MTGLPLIPLDHSAWSIDAEPTPAGVVVVVAFLLDGQPITIQFELDRSEARTFADGVLAAAGDGTMRTFPRPQSSEV